MNRYLYFMAKTSSPNQLYQEVFLDKEDLDFLVSNNIYHVPSEHGNGKFMVGMFQLRTLLAM